MKDLSDVVWTVFSESRLDDNIRSNMSERAFKEFVLDDRDFDRGSIYQAICHELSASCRASRSRTKAS